MFVVNIGHYKCIQPLNIGFKLFYIWYIYNIYIYLRATVNVIADSDDIQKSNGSSSKIYDKSQQNHLSGLLPTPCLSVGVNG